MQMAQIFREPTEVGEAPQLSDFFKERRLDVEALRAAEEEWIEKLRQWVKANTDSNSDLVGYVANFPMADGYASYMVFRTKPLQLIHLPIADYRLQEFAERGIRVKDIRDKVEFERMWRELGEKKRKERENA